MDVAVATVLSQGLRNELEDFIFSYDVNCKYSKKFFDRVAQPSEAPLISEALVEKLQTKVTWLIPKFHLGLDGSNYSNLLN